MLINNLKIAFRNLAKHKLFTLINIFGLAIGLALCLIMIGHVSFELSFEDAHENKDHIYRVNGQYNAEDTELRSARVMAPLGQALVDELPEVNQAAIFRVIGNATIELDGLNFKTDSGPVRHTYEQGGNVICANPGFLDLFTFPIIQGNPATALVYPFSVLISEDIVDQYFYGRNPLGEVIKLNDEFECQITGILKNVPENTQLHCDFIVSYSSLDRIGENTKSWDQFDKDYVYLLLDENANIAAIEQKIPAILSENLNPEMADRYQFELQPLDDIYFGSFMSGRGGELFPHGEASVMYVWAIVAGFILILAIVNFINLSTARSADRMREVGVRKVFGAFRGHLVRQFMGESFLITFISTILGLVVFEIFKMWVKPLLPRQMFADFYSHPMMLVSVIVLLVVVAITAGFYPSLYLSRFKPITILSGKTSIKSSRSVLRKTLVIFQFVIAITLTTSTIILYNQINYITTFELGFEKDNILILDFEGGNAAANCKIMRNEILKDRNILSATINNCPPGRSSYRYHGFYTENDFEESDPLTVKLYEGDNDFLSTFGLEIIEGRHFSESESADINRAIIINESMAEVLEIDNPIGYRLYRKDGFYDVIGVVKDFYGTRLDYGFFSMSAIILNPDSCKTLCLKLSPDNINGSIASIQDTWESTLPGDQFTYAFLDDVIKSRYSEYDSMGALFLTLSLITVSIACLGIFALVSYAAGQRTKEIGIRKVLGSSVTGIALLLSKEFALLIIIANVIAWPLAYLAMNGILGEFAFRVGIGPGTFALTGLIAIALALLSAGFQAIKAAQANPVDTLRHE